MQAVMNFLRRMNLLLRINIRDLHQNRLRRVSMRIPTALILFRRRNASDSTSQVTRLRRYILPECLPLIRETYRYITMTRNLDESDSTIRIFLLRWLMVHTSLSKSREITRLMIPLCKQRKLLQRKWQLPVE